MGAKGKPFLDVILGWDLDSGGEGVPLLPEQIPPTQGVPVVGQLHVVGGSDVDDDDVAACGAQHHVTRNIVDIAALEKFNCQIKLHSLHYLMFAF